MTALTYQAASKTCKRCGGSGIKPPDYSHNAIKAVAQALGDIVGPPCPDCTDGRVDVPVTETYCAHCHHEPWEHEDRDMTNPVRACGIFEARTRPAPWSVMVVGDPYLDCDGKPEILKGWQLDALPAAIATFGAEAMSIHFTLDLDHAAENDTRRETGLLP